MNRALSLISLKSAAFDKELRQHFLCEPSVACPLSALHPTAASGLFPGGLPLAASASVLLSLCQGGAASQKVSAVPYVPVDLPKRDL